MLTLDQIEQLDKGIDEINEVLGTTKNEILDLISSKLTDKDYNAVLVFGTDEG